MASPTTTPNNKKTMIHYGSVIVMCFLAFIWNRWFIIWVYQLTVHLLLLFSAHKSRDNHGKMQLLTEYFIYHLMGLSLGRRLVASVNERKRRETANELHCLELYRRDLFNTNNCRSASQNYYLRHGELCVWSPDYPRS